MPPRVRYRRASALPPLAVLAALALSGCSSLGDFGRLRDDLVTDDIHAWVGRDAAAIAGAPISTYNLTDEERVLRDLAFPLIEPTYERQRWDAVIYEYGINRYFHRNLWVSNRTAYYAHLQWKFRRSSTARYNQLIDDVRNDIVRIEPFFSTARRVVDIDQRRGKSMEYLTDIAPPERLNALARIGENTLTVAWVQHSLTERCAGYRFALDHLVVAEPEPIAAEAERVLVQLQQQIAANELVAPPQFAAPPPRYAERPAPVTK